MVDAFNLDDNDVVIDLGCGTGQLTLPMARRARTILAVDPEADMLQRGRKASEDLQVANIAWMIGADTDIPTVHRLLGDRSYAPSP